MALAPFDFSTMDIPSLEDTEDDDFYKAPKDFNKEEVALLAEFAKFSKTDSGDYVSEADAIPTLPVPTEAGTSTSFMEDMLEKNKVQEIDEGFSSDMKAIGGNLYSIYDAGSAMFSNRWDEVMDDPIGEFTNSAKPAVLGFVNAINETINTVDAIAEGLGASEADPLQIPTDWIKYKKEDGAKGFAQEGTKIITQFLASFGAWGKVLNLAKTTSATGKWTKYTIQTAIAEGSAMDPEASRLSNMLQDNGWENPVSDMLAMDPNDPELLSRAKMAVEGAMIGAAADTILLAAKGVVTGLSSWRRTRESMLEVEASKDLSGDYDAGLNISTGDMEKKLTRLEGLEGDELKAARIQIEEDKVINPVPRWGDTVDLPMLYPVDKGKIDKSFKTIGQLQKILDKRKFAPMKQQSFGYLEGGAGKRTKEFDLVPQQEAVTMSTVKPTSKRLTPTSAEQVSLGLDELQPIYKGQTGLEGDVTIPFGKQQELESISRGDAVVKPVPKTPMEEQLSLPLAGGKGTALRDRVPVDKKGRVKEDKLFTYGDKVIQDMRARALAKGIANRDFDIINNAAIQDTTRSRALLAQLAGTGVSGYLGYEVGGVEGMLYAGAIGFGLMRYSGSLGAKMESAAIENMGSFTSRPVAKLRHMGDVGELGAEMLEEAGRNTRHSYGKRMSAYKEAVKGLNREELFSIREVMQRDKKSLSKAQALAVGKVRKVFNDTMNAAVDAGVHSRAEADRLMKKQDYWPRMMDEGILSTSKGKKQFIDTFSGKLFTKEQAEDISNHLLHSNDAAQRWFKKNIDAMSTKEGVRFTKAMSQQLFDHHRSSTIVQRASHLEKTRKLPKWLDKSLNPFMIKDPNTVMSKYIDETTTRIENAKIFGPKDETANWIENTLRDAEGIGSTRNADFWRNTFATQVKDGKNSDVVVALSGLSPGARNFLDKADALQTFKLSAAQILNVGQTFANAPVYLSKYYNPGKSYAMTMTSFFKSLGKEGGEVAARSGAAAETVIMEMAGEAAGMHKFLGISPSAFLRWTGFTAVEKFNRRFAANLGKAHFEDLMAKKGLIESGKITDKKKIAAIYGGLRELKVDITMPTASMSKESLNEAGERAAGAFSDKVNFTNNAEQMPYAWRSPYMRLTRKFKTFMFHQGVFFKENVLKEANRGNFNPMVTYLIGSATLVGYPLSKIREILNGDDSEYTTTERMVRNLTTIGAIGISLDTANAFTSSYGANVAGAVGGPMGSDMYKWYNTMGAVIKNAATGGEQGLDPLVAAGRTSLQVFGGLPGKKIMMEELKERQKEKREAARGSVGKASPYSSSSINKGIKDYGKASGY